MYNIFVCAICLVLFHSFSFQNVHTFVLFFWSRKPYLQLYVRVRDETKKLKKPVNDIIEDVGNEVDAVRHSFINKPPVSFIFSEPLIIIDDQWLLKYGG